MAALFTDRIEVRRGGVTPEEKEEFRLRYGPSTGRMKPYIPKSMYVWVQTNGGSFLIKQLIMLAMMHENEFGSLMPYVKFTDTKHPLDGDEMYRPEFKIPESWKAWIHDRANQGQPVTLPKEAAMSRFFRWLITEGRGY